MRDPSLQPTGSARTILDALENRIHGEIKRVFAVENAYAWLALPQPLLEMRIPARMLATGEGGALLAALSAARPA